MTARIMLEFEEMPEAKDLALIVSLAEKINAKVVGLSGKKLALHGKNSAPIELGFEKFPADLSAFAVSPDMLDAISTTFDEELTAEELCSLLTT